MYELFAGIPGYIVECVSGLLSPGSTVSSFLSALRDRIHKILQKNVAPHEYMNFAKSLHLSLNANTLTSVLQDTGLCGRKPPPFPLLVFVLEWISYYYDPDDLDAQINRIQRIKSNVGPNDQGLVGSLLEYELILQLKKCVSFVFAQFDLLGLNKTWKRGPDVTLSGTNWTKVYSYQEQEKKFNEETKFFIFFIPITFSSQSRCTTSRSEQ